MDDKQIFLSTDLAHRLAAIDIGSNSVRLMVADPLRGGSYRILDEEREPTRLGRTLSSTGTLDPQAVELTLAALRRFKQIAAGYQVAELKTIATCAVREAVNGPEFCRRVKDEVGIDVEVISSDLEAHLAFYSVQRAFDLTGKNVVVADIGGGSTEIVLASGNVIESIASTSLGAVRLTEIYGNGPGMVGEDYEHMVESIDRTLKKQAQREFFAPHLLIGSGGTFTSMAEMMMASRKQVGLPTRGYLLSRAEVSHMLDRLRKMPLKARRQVPGLAPDRADIIVAGIAVVDRLMRRFNVNLLQVHSRGVRDGLLLTMIDNTLGVPSANPADREAAISRFAAACTGEYELAHGRQVARLAGRIFEQMAERFRLNPDDRALLEAAARLQDVGYLINYDQHHKHSYHLILNSRLAGFRPRELELIANIARYHRGARPKQKHANFRQLSPDDQQRVEQLAAILRLAGGLDRSHSQQVKDVTLQPSPHSAKQMELLVHADFNPEVDLWGARRRTKLFKRVFGIKLSVECTAHDHSTIEESPPAPGSPSADLKAKAHADTTGAFSNGTKHDSVFGNGKSRNGHARKSGRDQRNLGR
ncbi:MAG TPA: Ppx/GppA phosphatase family protein [Pirellulales bacterium]|jgi:exopolyphosphatase/guanosine-5'-triphosphate,3'-diphosphate pyrophosphatase|nr:Ppx/GppA phosphatase family protein [Pirellulales bacterium]